MALSSRLSPLLPLWLARPLLAVRPQQRTSPSPQQLPSGPPTDCLTDISPVRRLPPASSGSHALRQHSPLDSSGYFHLLRGSPEGRARLLSQPAAERGAVSGLRVRRRARDAGHAHQLRAAQRPQADRGVPDASLFRFDVRVWVCHYKQRSQHGRHVGYGFAAGVLPLFSRLPAALTLPFSGRSLRSVLLPPLIPVPTPSVDLASAYQTFFPALLPASIHRDLTTHTAHPLLLRSQVSQTAQKTSKQTSHQITQVATVQKLPGFSFSKYNYLQTAPTLLVSGGCSSSPRTRGCFRRK